MTKKIQFKGPVTKWEKRWVTVGHMKLLKWVPLKTKRPNPQSISGIRKEGSSRQSQASLNMETRYSRSGRRDRTKTTDDHEKEIEMLYLSSLPKTRRTSRKIDQLQKKHLQDAGVSDDLHPSSADEKPVRNTVKKTPSSVRVNKSMLSPSSDPNALGSDSEQPNTSGGTNTPNTSTTTTTTTTTTSTSSPTIKSVNGTIGSNAASINNSNKDKSKDEKMLDDDDDDLEDDSKLDSDEDSSSSEDEAIIGNTSVNDEDEDEDEDDDIKPQQQQKSTNNEINNNNSTTTTSTNGNNTTSNDNNNNNNSGTTNEGLGNSLDDKMEFDSLPNIDTNANSNTFGY